MFRRTFHIIATIVLVLASCATCTMPLAAQTDSLQQQLSSMYQGKKVVLAVPTCGRKLKFDANGNPAGKHEAGSWTVCSAVRVDEVRTDTARIHVSGERIYYVYDSGQHKFHDVADNMDHQSDAYSELLKKQQVSIEIALPPGTDESRAQELISKTFKLEPQNAVLIDKNSGLWKDFVPGTTDTMKQEPDPVLKDAGNPNAHVVPPEGLHMPDPPYTQEARDARVEGTTTLTVTIDHDGTATDIKVPRPIGVGLEEKAAERVSHWKFRPAMKDGKPVAVRVSVEVNYSFY